MVPSPLHLKHRRRRSASAAHEPARARSESVVAVDALVGRFLNGQLDRDGENIAAAAAHVFDVELLSELFGQLLCHKAAKHIGWPTGRVRDDHAYWSCGIGLRPRDARYGGKGNRARGQIQKIAARRFHLNLPLTSHHSITSSAR